MKDQILLVDLYDCYHELLTEKQQIYFEDYYFENLSLAEMAENYKISRNAIHKSLKEVEIKLHFYEEKLKINVRNHQIERLITETKDLKIKEQLNQLID